MNISPQVKSQERDAILLLRTIKQADVTFHITDGLPAHAYIPFPQCLDRKNYHDGILSHEEKTFLNSVHFLKFGTIVVKVQEGLPIKIISGEQRMKLGSVDWREWEHEA